MGEYLKNFVFVRTDLLDAVPINMIPLWYLFFLFVAELLYTVLRNKRLLAVGIAFWHISQGILIDTSCGDAI